jgi:hypothetical protein
VSKFAVLIKLLIRQGQTLLMSAQEFQKFHKISLVVDETAAPKSLETT